MVRPSLSFAARWAWPALAAVAVLAAVFVLGGLDQNDGGAATVAEAGRLRQSLLRVAAGADEAMATGDATGLEAATDDLDASYQALSASIAAVLGAEVTGRHLAVLGPAIAELADAAAAYAGGGGSAGAGGSAFTTAALAVDELVDALALEVDSVAASGRSSATNATLLIMVAAVILSATLWRADRRNARLRERAEASGLELSELVRELPERLAAEQELRSSEERFRAVLNTTQDGVMIVGPDGRLLLHNRALADLLGYPDEELDDLSVGQLVPAETLEQIMALLSARLWSDAAPTHHEVQMVRRDGEVVDTDMSVAAYREADQKVGVLVEVRDLTESKRASDTIRRMADYDALTGLPNRALFDRYVQRALDDAERVGRSVAVLMIDLDRFKLINDTLGHPSGDRLLKAVAKRLSGHLPPRLTLARFGGDEFLVLVPDAGGQEAAEVVARSVVDSFAADFEHEGRELRVTGSVGLAVYPDHGSDSDSLIRNAGAAMYQAKARSGNRYATYRPDGEESARDRLSLEAELRHAIDNEEFFLQYQPEIHIESGKTVAVEALIRWRHPERGEVQPDDFIPLVEDTGLIVPLGEWILRTACEQMRAWHEEGLPAVRIAVNLSARQLLEPDFAAMVKRVLDETGLAPSFLELEVTETTAMQNADAVPLLQEIRDMGIGTSLDDFGTGHSSLGRLSQFPVDALKIDRSFVSGAEESSADPAIVRGIIALGHAMGLSVVAEGVETEAQLAMLRYLDCDLAQGYGYSPALDADALAELLSDHAEGLRVA